MNEQRATIILRQADGTELDLTDEVRTTYDIAVGNMDSGSGARSTEEIMHLRRVQAALRAEPIEYGGDPCEDCAHSRDVHHMAGEAGGCYARIDPPMPGGPSGPYLWSGETRQCPCAGFTFEGKRQAPYS